MIEQVEFDPPMVERPDILVIAGEHSGDQHAARIVQEIQRLRPELYVCAVGGPALEKAGAQMLYDLTETSVVGFVEVLKNYSFFKMIFNEVADWIEIYRPRVTIFVDYPGFNLRLVEDHFRKGTQIKAGGTMKFYYYIGPQIWAWKAKRRFKMAEQIDSLGVIFPFEVDCYKDTDLDVKFLGHPFVADDYELPVAYDANAPVLLLPGSRSAAVGRIFPLMLNAFEKHLEKAPEETAVVIYPSDAVKALLKVKLEAFPKLKGKIKLTMQEGVIGAKAVLTSSGTMSLNAALAGIPGAIVYKANPITYILARYLVKIEYLGISNILLKKPMYPEFIQGAAEPDTLAKQLDDCVNNPERIQSTEQDAVTLRELLKGEDTLPPYKWIFDALGVKVPQQKV